MIHQVSLPPVTRKRLTDVVMLQVRLLYYASSTSNPDEADCAFYLDQHARFRGRGAQIAGWVWRASKRWMPLEQFSEGPVPDKYQWSRLLAEEAVRFLRRPLGRLAYPVNRNAPEWQKNGAEFLRNFYEDLCQHAGLPGYLFSEAVSQPFSRQDFLAAFENDNSKLYICAACDEADYSTKASGAVKSHIEHYLPKSRYPHLACHPYNLLPICSRCNELKGQRDPLGRQARTRHRLEDIFLPYREAGLGARTYLRVRLGASIRQTQLGPLRSKAAIDIRQKIRSFSAVYEIPNRWQEQIDKIGERLFLRIGELIQVFGLPPDHNNPHVVLPVLELCLYFLDERDQGIQPFAFAMTWWLVALITDEVEPLIQNPSRPTPQPSALLQEVSAWSERMDTLPPYEASGQAQYHTRARRLLRFVQEDA